MPPAGTSGSRMDAKKRPGRGWGVHPLTHRPRTSRAERALPVKVVRPGGAPHGDGHPSPRSPEGGPTVTG
jgi:hypothetical protein